MGFMKPRIPNVRAPKPQFAPTPSPSAYTPSQPQEGTANVGTADSVIGTSGTESLIRHTSRKAQTIGGKRSLLGG